MRLLHLSRLIIILRSVSAQENYDNNVSQVPQSVAYCAEPRVQALQNTGYAATPEVSPSATPQQTDDEVDELPDVIAVHNKRLLKRQRSKETQNNGQY